MERDMTEFNRRLDALADACMNSQRFDQALYVEHDVKRGLRDSNGNFIYFFTLYICNCIFRVIMSIT